MDQLMACRGVLLDLWCLKTTGALRVEIEIPKELANEAHRLLGGYPDPAKPTYVAVAVIVETT